MTKYFVPEPETLEELKSLYRKLAMLHHPDRGGSEEEMKAVNNEFDKLFPRLKNVHKNKEGVKYERETEESPDFFKDLIAELMKMEGIAIEVIGCFVWVTGNTKVYKEELKAMKFHWHSDKFAWYLKPDWYVKYGSKSYSFSEIRSMYGTSGKVNSKGKAKLDDSDVA